jgi:hypothetical protein
MAIGLFGVLTNPALAQSGNEQSRRWQVDVVAGVALFELPTSGEAALPAPGPTLTATSPIYQSRRVPTWFLSDGASLVNGANREFGVATQLPPIDDVLGGLGLAGSNAPMAGLRAARYFNDRLALELGLTLHQGSSEIDPAVVDAAEAAAAGFDAAFTGLFSNAAFSNVSVSSSSTVAGATTRELLSMVALRVHVLSGRTSPYVTVGGGVLSGIGARPSVTLRGDYTFTYLGGPSFAESDTLTIGFKQPLSVQGLVGAGFKTDLSPRIGLVVDGRAMIGKPTYTLTLDSAPTVETRTPAGFVESGTTPSVHFSNNSSTGRLSSLSGDPLTGFEAFRSSDWQVRYVITAGIAIWF